MAIVARKRKQSTCYLVVHRSRGRQVWERVADEDAAKLRDPAMKAELEAGTYVPTKAHRKTARSARFAARLTKRSA
jgi:hypothetical protein